MKIKNLIAIEIINVIVIFLLLAYFFSSLTLLQRLNLQGANIMPNEERFRFFIIRNDGEFYITKNVSYNWMVENGITQDGKFITDHYTGAYIVHMFCSYLIYPAPFFGCSATGFDIKVQAYC